MQKLGLHQHEALRRYKETESSASSKLAKFHSISTRLYLRLDWHSGKMAVQENEDTDCALGDLDDCHSLLERIEMLPIELIDRIITLGLFSVPFGSHKALHAFQLLACEKSSTSIGQRIAIVFGSQFMRRQIERQWQLWSNPADAKSCQYASGETSGMDLASWCLLHCYSCFQFLLRHQSVQACSYRRTGESFFYLAMQNKNTGTMELILSFMGDEQLFQPCDLRAPDLSRESIFQVSTTDESSFRAVWKRSRLLPSISPSCLRAPHIWQISMFADIKLADELYRRGINLGGSYREGDDFPRWWSESPGWWAILNQQDPVPLMEWLQKVGYQPPAGYLLQATRLRNLRALSWILERAQSYQDWKEAAFAAAEDVFAQNGDVLEFILQHPAPDRRDNILLQDLSIKIINSVCQLTQREQSQWAMELDHQHLWPSTSQLEESALLKIRVLGRFKMDIDVVGLKIQTEHAGLHRLTEILENIRC